MRREMLMCALALTLLVQPVLGMASAGKPDKPLGKPERPGERKAVFRISIGIEGEDIVLTKVSDSDNVFFAVETSVSGWYPDEKGRKDHVWKIPIYKDRSGFYEMDPLDGLYTGELAQLGWLEHHWKTGEYDYWTLDINWYSEETGDDLFLDGTAHSYEDSYWQFVEDAEGSSTWVVRFINAYFDVDCWTGGRRILWQEHLTFTVTIQKIP